MAFIPLPNTIKIVLEYTIGDKPVVNVQFFNKGSTVTQSDLEDLCGVVDGWDTSYGQNVRPTASFLERITATNESTQAGEAFILTLASPRQGDLNESVLPNNVAACLSLRTGLRGRSYRGRLFIGGITEPAVSGDTLDNAYIDDFLDAYDQLQALTETAGYTWVVASRYHNNAPRVTGIVTPITELRMNDRVDTQRRRLD